MTIRFTLLAALAATLAVAPAGPARADSPAGPRAYAIVVGSNPGGPGQQTLRFAERDAKTMAMVLGQLGRFPAANLVLLARPTPERLRGAIAAIATKIRNDARAGRESVLLFYYSGHARANALNLGRREVSLDELRATLLSVPATLKIVILDACQSGAFSGVKGAKPAADFSVNSLSRLGAAGVAVMASSSSTELSQESTRLGASYFTHYLVVALRGAGDRNRDGKVSLDEAYQYAYHRTLAATARTAVGKQHVTLETDLKGKGEISLTYPARADAHFELSAFMRGEVLVQKRGGPVMVELHKVPGKKLRVALPAGRYTALVRAGGKVRECQFALRVGSALTLDPSGCPEVTRRADLSKGGGWVPRERWVLEVGLSAAPRIDDRYLQRLSDFGYEEDEPLLGARPRLSVSLVRTLSPRFQVVGRVAGLSAGSYLRGGDTTTNYFNWTAYGASVLARAYTSSPTGLVSAFAEAGGGVSYARTSLDRTNEPSDTASYVGWLVTAGGGVALTPWRWGFYASAHYTASPTIDNLVGDTHDVGGIQLNFGLRGRL